MAQIKARDVKDILRSQGFEKGTAHLLQIILEQQSAYNQELKEMAQMVDKMSDIIGNFAMVAAEMKKTAERFDKKYRGGNDDDPTVV